MSDNKIDSYRRRFLSQSAAVAAGTTLAGSIDGGLGFIVIED